jgi:hypothetical protein
MIPGWIVALLTFPGVIVHEVGHMLFCRLRGVAVLDYCFLRTSNPVGYVIHESPKDFLSTFLISVGPFIVNSLMCIIICLPALLPTQYFHVEEPVSYVVLWLGISIGMHAFPSTQDASELLKHAKVAVTKGSLLAIISFPLVGLIYIVNILSVVWADYAYGLAIGLWLPAKLL